MSFKTEIKIYILCINLNENTMEKFSISTKQTKNTRKFKTTPKNNFRVVTACTGPVHAHT